ncbi:MAG: hypothetical protein J6P78_08225 [Lachnospiraceae bacterium]|nr:hypothetical protein [Lachnospiraceae bacterium]
MMKPETILRAEGIPRCDCGGVIKPNVVLYGEPLPKYVCIGARREIANADTLIVAGTSLSVEPAASFVGDFREKHLIIINREPTPADKQAELVIRGDVAKVLSFQLPPMKVLSIHVHSSRSIFRPPNGSAASFFASSRSGGAQTNEAFPFTRM